MESIASKYPTDKKSNIIIILIIWMYNSTDNANDLYAQGDNRCLV